MKAGFGIRLVNAALWFALTTLLAVGTVAVGQSMYKYQDADGNWIELSQRRSLTGALPRDEAPPR